MASTDTWGDVMRLVKSKGSMDVNLKGAEKGKVVTRFPPEPSGFLHIGHAKAAMLNDYFARHYEGKLIVRFDDTNTDKATQGFEDAIIKDLDRLGIKPDKVEYTSDYFDKLLVEAEKFILKDKAYVDGTLPEEMKEQRLKKQANEYRSQSIEENLRLWKEMIKGTKESEGYVLRAKIDIRHKNGAMRDPTMYRLKKLPHHRKGFQYNVYPTYDFSCPLVDSWEGVTHALRSLEYKDREKQYQWFVKTAEIENSPNVWEFSRLDFVKTVLSKRKLQTLIDINAAKSWDDPRFPTIQGVRRRGMTIQGLRAFILSQGASRNNTTQEWDKIWTVNKRVIDPIAPRHAGINVEKGRKVIVQNATDGIKQVPKHKKNGDLGTKNVIYQKEIWIEGEDADTFEVNETVTFMDWGNMKIDSINGKELTATYMPEDLNFKGTKKVTWLADVEDLVDLKICQYSDILTKDRLEEDDEMVDFINKNSEQIEFIKGDINLKLLKKGDTIQLERRGYYICDSTVSPITLIEVPDGRKR